MRDAQCWREKNHQSQNDRRPVTPSDFTGQSQHGLGSRCGLTASVGAGLRANPYFCAYRGCQFSRLRNNRFIAFT